VNIISSRCGRVIATNIAITPANTGRDNNNKRMAILNNIHPVNVLFNTKI
jgi:hypothetical protein